MTLAVEQLAAALGRAPGHVLVDGNRLPRWGYAASAIVGGDAVCLSIAAASVVAKVTRDRLLRAADNRFSGYGFAEGKGYPNPAHRAALLERGATVYHRRSWSFMEGLPDIGEPRRIGPRHG